MNRLGISGKKRAVEAANALATAADAVNLATATAYTDARESAVRGDMVRGVATIAAMRALAGLANGVLVNVASYAAGNDGGGGVFVWDSASAATVDSGIVFDKTGGGAGRFIRRANGVPSVRWWGAKGDGATNDTTAVQAAVNYATASGGVLDVPEGVYMVDQVRVSARSADANGEQTTRLRLIGRGESSVIRSRVAGELVYIGNAGGNEIADIELRDLTIDGANLATIGVRLALSRRVRFAGVRIVRSAGDGFSIGDAAIGPVVFERGSIASNAGHGLRVLAGADARCSLHVIGAVISGNTGSGVRVQGGAAAVIQGGELRSNGNGGIVTEAGAVEVLGVNAGSHTAGTYKANVAALTGTKSLLVDGGYCEVTNASGQLYGVYIDQAANVSVRGRIITGSNSTGSGIHFTDASSGIVAELVGNSITGVLDKVRRPSAGLARCISLNSGEGSGIGPVFGGLELSGVGPKLRLVDTSQATTDDEWNLSNDSAALKAVAEGVEVVRLERVPPASPAGFGTTGTSLRLRMNNGASDILGQVIAAPANSTLSNFGSAYRLLMIKTS